MHLEPTEARLVGTQLGLNDEDVEKITKLQRGQGMLLTSQIKTIVNVVPSGKEDYEFTTDPIKIRQYAIMEQG